MGSVQHLINGQEQNTALPFVYALLKSKIQEAIRGFKVFENTKTQADSDELKIDGVHYRLYLATRSRQFTSNSRQIYIS